MQIVGGYEKATHVLPLVYAIGNFDGVHLGHVSLIRKAQEIAAVHKTKCGVYTFWPHPRSVLSQSSVKLICTREQKMRGLKEQGVDVVIEEPFTPDFSTMSAEAFCERVIGKALRAIAVVTGPNFHFGHKAQGTPDKMAAWLKPLGIEHILVPAMKLNGVLCSSGRIRDAVAAGDIANANLMLGRNFSIVGNVVKGEGRGHTIGFPTANLDPESTLIPATGVYATRVCVDGVQYKAATNIGTRPTFSSASTVYIESHLLNFDQDIYGKRVEIYFLNKIRDEKKFRI